MADGAGNTEIVASVKGRSVEMPGDRVADLADAFKISFDEISPNPWQRDGREEGIS
jgi:hypothetical protein